MTALPWERRSYARTGRATAGSAFHPEYAGHPPADAKRDSRSWRIAIEHTNGPVALVLTRQNLPVLDLQKISAAPTGVRSGGMCLPCIWRCASRYHYDCTGSEFNWRWRPVKNWRHKASGLACQLAQLESYSSPSLLNIERRSFHWKYPCWLSKRAFPWAGGHTLVWHRHDRSGSLWRLGSGRSCHA